MTNTAVKIVSVGVVCIYSANLKVNILLVYIGNIRANNTLILIGGSMKCII